MRRTSLSALTAALLLLSACSGLGSIADILGSIGGTGQQQQQQQGQMQAEVQQIDTNGQRIYIRTQNGQSGYVRFDSQTQVIYRQQRHPVTALERGDIVVMQVQQISQNEIYASRIDVTQSVRDR
jgi:outer membrane biogenesis lipoprotein LolB